MTGHVEGGGNTSQPAKHDNQNGPTVVLDRGQKYNFLTAFSKAVVCSDCAIHGGRQAAKHRQHIWQSTLGASPPTPAPSGLCRWPSGWQRCSARRSPASPCRGRTGGPESPDAFRMRTIWCEVFAVYWGINGSVGLLCFCFVGGGQS